MEKQKTRAELNLLAQKIVGCAFEVGKHLKYGYLEKVYENAMVYELKKIGLRVQQQYPIKVNYKEIVAGDYIVDLLIEEKIPVELKTAKNIDDAHIAQCLNYLAAADLRLGLLLNFGEKKIEFKRFVNKF
jgi:GxxExxY protein